MLRLDIMAAHMPGMDKNPISARYPSADMAAVIKDIYPVKHAATLGKSLFKLHYFAHILQTSFPEPL
jgi:hypothetical protein